MSHVPLHVADSLTACSAVSPAAHEQQLKLTAAVWSSCACCAFSLATCAALPASWPSELRPLENICGRGAGGVGAVEGFEPVGLGRLTAGWLSKLRPLENICREAGWVGIGTVEGWFLAGWVKEVARQLAQRAEGLGNHLRGGGMGGVGDGEGFVASRFGSGRVPDGWLSKLRHLRACTGGGWAG